MLIQSILYLVCCIASLQQKLIVLNSIFHFTWIICMVTCLIVQQLNSFSKFDHGKKCKHCGFSMVFFFSSKSPNVQWAVPANPSHRPLRFRISHWLVAVSGAPLYVRTLGSGPLFILITQERGRWQRQGKGGGGQGVGEMCAWSLCILVETHESALNRKDLTEWSRVEPTNYPFLKWIRAAKRGWRKNYRTCSFNSTSSLSTQSGNLHESECAKHFGNVTGRGAALLWINQVFCFFCNDV